MLCYLNYDCHNNQYSMYVSRKSESYLVSEGYRNKTVIRHHVLAC